MHGGRSSLIAFSSEEVRFIGKGAIIYTHVLLSSYDRD